MAITRIPVLIAALALCTATGCGRKPAPPVPPAASPMAAGESEHDRRARELQGTGKEIQDLKNSGRAKGAEGALDYAATLNKGAQDANDIIKVAQDHTRAFKRCRELEAELGRTSSDDAKRATVEADLTAAHEELKRLDRALAEEKGKTQRETERLTKELSEPGNR